MLLGCWLVGHTISVWWASDPRALRRVLADPQVRRLLVVLAVSVAGIALVNPHGPFIYSNTLQMSRHPNVNSMDEWQPISMDKTEALVYLYVASLVLLAGVQLASPRWYSPAQLIVLIVFGIQPLFHVRMMVWWFMLVPWLALSHWPAIREGLAWRLPAPGVPSLRKTLLAVLVLLVLASWSAPAQWVLSKQPAPLARAVFGGTPWQVAAQLKDPTGEPALPVLGQALARYPRGRFTGVVFASETLGDHLVWALAPRIPVFIYTHVHLFIPEAWQQCTVVKFALPGWRKLLDYHHVNLVVIEPEMYPELRTQLSLDNDWQVLVDESGNETKLDNRARLLVALRKEPR
jgi:hypothetical protein